MDIPNFLDLGGKDEKGDQGEADDNAGKTGKADEKRRVSPCVDLPALGRTPS